MTTRTLDRDKRAALLRAARDVLVEEGYHHAKIDEIAARAGVAKGTYYLYFDDKRAIFAELVDGLVGRIEAAIVRVDERADLGAQVRHNIRATIAVLAEDLALARLVLGVTRGLDAAFDLAQVRRFNAYPSSELPNREACVTGPSLLPKLSYMFAKRAHVCSVYYTHHMSRYSIVNGT
jgi:AcrR family transcriptional regulator